jgi:hypothetical protein
MIPSSEIPNGSETPEWSRDRVEGAAGAGGVDRGAMRSAATMTSGRTTRGSTGSETVGVDT